MSGSIFKNYNQLISKGDVELRKDGLAIAQAGIEKGIPYDILTPCSIMSAFFFLHFSINPLLNLTCIWAIILPSR